jgi:hypothetical protein
MLLPRQQQVTRISKMATVEVNQMAFEQTFIAPNKHNQQVPNHLLDTSMSFVSLKL